MGEIVSDKYREEQARLMADPIIREMAATVVADPPPWELDSWNFIVAAGNEYKRRGGTQQESIGGPAKAIAALVAEGGPCAHYAPDDLCDDPDKHDCTCGWPKDTHR
jgi:hypothetical protein